MKTAIIINGHVRTWEKCKDSFISTFDNIDADIFVSVYDQQYGYAQYIRDIQDFQEEKALTTNTIYQMFDGLNVKEFLIDNVEAVAKLIEEEKSNIKLVFNTEKHGSGIFDSVYPQYRKLHEIKNIVMKYEQDNNFMYDRIIKTRTELIYNDEIANRAIKLLDDDQFLIDAGNVTPNDVMFVTSRENAFKVIDFIYDEFFNPLYPEASVHWPPHSILDQALKHNNINTVSRRLIKHVEREKLQQVY